MYFLFHAANSADCVSLHFAMHSTVLRYSNGISDVSFTLAPCSLGCGSEKVSLSLSACHLYHFRLTRELPVKL